MRTLAVDALRLSARRTAMGRYIEYLAQQWSRMDMPFGRIVLHLTADVDRDSLCLGSRTPVEIRVDASKGPLALWEQFVLPARARGAAVLFCPSYVAPLRWAGALVVANHGIYEGISGEFSLLERLRTTPLFRWSAHKAARVIANSESTRMDLVRHLGVDGAKIDVVPPAAHDRFQSERTASDVSAAVERLTGSRRPYVLFVGKLSRRRNVPSLIEAFASVTRELNSPHRLVIVGPPRGTHPVRLGQGSGISDRVHWIPHLEQEDLALLYRGAEVFALPTTHEGASWTILEAMASGVPVLTVRHPALAEGPADAVFAIADPSVDAIAGGLKRLITDARLREQLGAAGKAYAARRTWSDIARSTAEVLDRVAAPEDSR